MFSCFCGFVLIYTGRIRMNNWYLLPAVFALLMVASAIWGVCWMQSFCFQEMRPLQWMYWIRPWFCFREQEYRWMASLYGQEWFPCCFRSHTVWTLSVQYWILQAEVRNGCGTWEDYWFVLELWSGLQYGSYPARKNVTGERESYYFIKLRRSTSYLVLAMQCYCNRGERRGEVLLLV